MCRPHRTQPSYGSVGWSMRPERTHLMLGPRPQSSSWHAPSVHILRSPNTPSFPIDYLFIEISIDRKRVTVSARLFRVCIGLLGYLERFEITYTTRRFPCDPMTWSEILPVFLSSCFDQVVDQVVDQVSVQIPPGAPCVRRCWHSVTVHDSARVNIRQPRRDNDRRRHGIAARGSSGLDA